MGIFFPKMFNFLNKNLKSENGIKNAFLIQAINAFVGGVTYIILPLLMLEKGVSIRSIGLVFAVLPLVSQANRLLFGIISDFVGRKSFYWLNGLMNFSFLGVYYFATNSLGFLLGKIIEGIKNASLWSVNRAYFLDYNKKSEKVLTKMSGIDSLFGALGILLAGFLVANLFYGKTLLLLIILSLLIFPNAKKLVNKKKDGFNFFSILRALDFRGKDKKFKNFLAIFFLIGLSWGLSSSYVFPLFLKEIGVSLENIGLLLGLRALLVGVFIYSLHSFLFTWSNKEKVLIGGLLTALTLLILPFTSIKVLPLLIIMMGAVTGIGAAGREAIFVEVADHNSLGADIGILMIGTHVGMSTAEAMSGFIIESFGFSIIFIAASVLYALFSLAAFYNMN